MAKRLLSASVAVAIGILVLWLDRKELFLISIAVISVMAVYEILLATKYLKNISVTAVSMLFVFALPFILNYDVAFLNTRYVSFAFIIALFVIMLFNHKKVNFAEVALTAFVSVCIPFSLSCIVFMFDYVTEAPNISAVHRTFCIVYALTITWISDSGAYFVGTFLGKHKMAPNISPKKTWEGFVGGLVTAVIFGFLLGKGYEITTLLVRGEIGFKVDLIFLSLLAVPCSILGVLGDLTASLLKRECMVKDFGEVMPGHGGILDRFDSVLFVMPFIYLAFLIYFPIVQV